MKKIATKGEKVGEADAQKFIRTQVKNENDDTGITKSVFERRDFGGKRQRRFRSQTSYTEEHKYKWVL